MTQPIIPQFLRLTNRPCLLIGENTEAIAKGRALLEAEADLYVVTDRPENWPSDLQDQITWLSPPFQPHHLDGVWLVVCALDNRPLNIELFAACQTRRIFLNVVDQTEFCSFIWPAVVKKPPFTLAITTGGRGPALAGWLRRKLETELPDNMEALADWYSDWRKKSRPFLPSFDERSRFWRAMIQKKVVETYLSGNINEADSLIKKALLEKKMLDGRKNVQ
ncbi:MAG: bifunctional precorrin-2 dehydrogenase/sirohydrochlorin ferrochelatase [Magnetococcales bacterium]|nr:bifunctional precorrin-2 dehydrogenase/sirohydrochlorin ferrochelatase [Magnetococcales bacterium]